MKFRISEVFSREALVFVLAVTSGSAYAQTSYGIVAGSVTDQSGAIVSTATVTVTSKDTGETHTSKTTSNGSYRFEALGTGTYDVIVEAPGFQRQVVSAILVQPSVTTSVTPVMKVGSATETIEVSSSSEILQTETGEVSATLSAAEISQLPINGLNAYTLVTTLPGVTTVTVGSGGNGPKFSVNGLRPRANNYLVEGQDNNDAGLTGQAFQPANTESVDNVTFLLNSFSAEFGNGGGAVSNLVFKSGTNSFHGSVFDRLFNSSLNAFDHGTTYNGGLKSKTRENIYGFTIGGPIIKNKLFIFGAYQQDHFRSTSQLSTLIVPTTAGYATLNALASGNSQIAKLVKAYGGLVGADPGSGKYPAQSKTVALGINPATGLDRGNVQFGGVQRGVGNTSNSSETDIKGDYLFNQDKDKLQLRYIRQNSLVPLDSGNFPSQLPGFDTNQGGPAYNTGIVETHQFSPRLLNEFRLSYSRILFTFDLQPQTYANSLALAPTVAISGVTGYGIPTNVPQGRGHNTYQLQDAISYSFGNHSLKAGFDVNQIRVRDRVPFVFYGSIGYQTSNARAAVGGVPAVPSYTALGNYIDDYSGYTTSTGQSITQNFGSNVARPQLTNQNYYVQDHWKATPRLALDYGIRYEYIGAPFNYLAYPALDLANPYAFQARVAQKPNYKNFAPRLGFAYTPSFSDKLVVRGGFGIFYDHLFTNIVDNIQATAPNASAPVFYGNQTTSGRGTPNFSGQFANLNKSPLPTNSQTTIVSNLRDPITYQYNLAIEQALPGAMSVTVAYAGTRGERLYSLEAINPTIAGGARVNTTRASIAAFANSGDSQYHGISVELQRKYRAGLLTRISYTFGKALDDVSDPYTSGNLSAYPEVEATLPTGGAYRGRDWGPSAYDHKQRAVLSLVYNTPTYHPSSGFGKVIAALVNTYEVSSITSFQSGSVYNIQTGFDINGDSITNDRPVLTNPNAPLGSFSVLATDFYAGSAAAANNSYCDGTYKNNASSKNPATGINDNFCHVVDRGSQHFFLGKANTQNATISRNASYTPGVFLSDATAQRSFHIHESVRFDIRAEAFNVLNHANTGIPSFTLYNTTDVPNAPGYTPGTFNNYASSTVGGRVLRFFGKIVF